MLCLLISVLTILFHAFLTILRVLFHAVFSTIFFCSLVFCVGNFLSQVATKHIAEVLSSVPKSKKVAMCLVEKIQLTLRSTGLNHVDLHC